MIKFNSAPRSDEMGRPLISVAMPVYNGEQYLAEAIESILAQTFKNFELIIIDDGSIDASLELLKLYEARDSRVRLIARENRNLATTLNDIVDLARGKWLARMDQDDIAFPKRLERQLEWLEETDADICGTWIRFFGTADKRIVKYAVSDAAIKKELLFCCAFAHPSVMMKSDVLRKLRYNPHWEKAEDYDLWIRAASSQYKMTNLPEVLLNYRKHHKQISSASHLRQQELTQKIRARYWSYVGPSIKLKKREIAEVLKLRDMLPISPDMDTVDTVFNKLLRSSEGESLERVFSHVTRLYFRVAADCPDIVSRWTNLNKKYGVGFGFKIKAQLWVMNKLSIKRNSKFFFLLKILFAK